MNQNFVNYVERMNGATNDKQPFVDIIQNVVRAGMSNNILQMSLMPQSRPLQGAVRILDFGSGGGALTSRIASEFSRGLYRGNVSVVGYDRSYDMVEMAQGYYVDRENLSFTSDKESLRRNSFDIIILSSVLHEVYSEGGEASVELLFKELTQFAKPGAIIISRDNFTLNYGKNISLKVRPERAQYVWEILSRFAELIPAKFRKHYCILGGAMARRPEPEILTIEGDFNIVVECLNKITWGMESLPRESQEILFWLSADKWRELNLNGWEIIGQAESTSVSYLEHLNDFVELDGQHWPTHMWTMLKLKGES